MRGSYSLPLLVLVLLVGCQGEKPGDPCDKFFQNTCKAPLTCITLSDPSVLLDKKVCARSCDHGFKCDKPEGCCPDGFACKEIKLSGGAGSGLSMGGYCLPASARQGDAPAGASASAAPSASAAVVVEGAPPLKGDPAACAAFHACCAPFEGKLGTPGGVGLACSLAPKAANGDCATALASIRNTFKEQNVPLPAGCGDVATAPSGTASARPADSSSRKKRTVHSQH